MPRHFNKGKRLVPPRVRKHEPIVEEPDGEETDEQQPSDEQPAEAEASTPPAEE